MLIAAIFGFLSLAALVGQMLQKYHVPGFQHSSDFGTVVMGTLGLHGTALICIWFFLQIHQVSWKEALGLRGRKLWLALLFGAFVAVIMIPMAGILQMVSGSILDRLGVHPAPEVAVTLLQNAGSIWQRVYLGIFAIVLAPVAEEFVFRGVLYPVIKQAGFPRLALFGVNALFAIIHLDATIFLPLFVLALAFTWLYETTDSLLAPIVAHALFNAANLAKFFMS